MEHRTNTDDSGALTAVFVSDGQDCRCTRTRTAPFELSECLCHGIIKASENVDSQIAVECSYCGRLYATSYAGARSQVEGQHESQTIRAAFVAPTDYVEPVWQDRDSGLGLDSMSTCALIPPLNSDPGLAEPHLSGEAYLPPAHDPAAAFFRRASTATSTNYYLTLLREPDAGFAAPLWP